MKKVLAHLCNHRIYSSLLQELVGSNATTVTAGVLHESIFDNFSKLKPDIVILPIYEYTQEFHTFVDMLKEKTEIIIFFGDVIHNDLIEYCSVNNIKTIRQHDMDTENIISYRYLYDDKLYVNLNSERNDKVLTILSHDNTINHTALDNILYPNTKIKMALINNPEFKHNQNVGVANSRDLVLLMNKFDSLVDLTQSYTIEAQACGIKNIKIDDNLIKNIESMTLIDSIDSIENYSVLKFVSNKLLTSMGA